MNSRRVACGAFSSAACLCARVLEIRDMRVALMWLPGDVGDALLTFWFSPGQNLEHSLTDKVGHPWQLSFNYE